MKSFKISPLGLVLLMFLAQVTKVSAWVLITHNNPAVSSPQLRHAGTLVYSIKDSSEALTQETETSDILTRKQQIAIYIPRIQYTVPGMKRGWKENGVWMDEDGPRNGPPQNFWRQMGDERLYNDNINLIQDLLKLNDFQGNVMMKYNFEQQDTRVFRNDMLNEMVERLERTNSIRIPTLNRLILGDWAPVVRGGKVVATSSTDKEKSIDFPYVFRIRRSAGRKLAPKTHYGTFDKHLEPGEEVTVEELSSSGIVASSGVLEVSSDKTENKLVEGYNNSNDGYLFLGGITYVTKYIMIMRQQVKQQNGANVEESGKVTRGPITEIWMRIDA